MKDIKFNEYFMGFQMEIDVQEVLKEIEKENQ